MIFGTIIPPALANHLWQSTLFAAAVALLILALRKNRAQVRYCLWLIASLKFLLPFSLLVAVGSHVQWPVSAPIPHAALSVAVEQIGQPFSASPLVLQPAVPHGPDLLLTIVLAVWLCGFARVLLRWLQSWLRVRAAVRASALLPIDAPIQIVSSPSLLEPGVFGFFRPVLLLPAGITGHLEPSHLKAILAHELCHVRRRDNLAAAVHMVVEALFWFHPLVWWIGLRLVEERELACDEEVLRLGNQPHVYAESILKTCQFYIESPLACVSGVTGSDLKKRIARIMNSGVAARLDVRKKLLLVTAAIVALVVPLAIGLLNASRAAPSPSLPTMRPRASLKLPLSSQSSPAMVA